MSEKAEHQDSGSKEIFAFAVMTFGMFIALLDIQIVASSMQQIGGGLSAANRAPYRCRIWAALTSLHRLFPGLKVEQLTSQFFRDQMDCVPLSALRAIEDELTTVIVKELGIKLDALFYDVTNFFTFIASTNVRPQLPQRGHSQQKRADLRWFSLALLVSREGHIPLCSHVFDAAAIAQLQNELYGKRILITDRTEWSDEQIPFAYRGQSEVEEAFRQLKDDEHMALRPQYHWTDQKIHVHTFCCLLALLLGRVVQFQARQLHYTQGLSGLLDLLGTVRLAMVLKPAGKHGGRPRCAWTLEHTAPDTMRLFRHLVPRQPPFVYT